MHAYAIINDQLVHMNTRVSTLEESPKADPPATEEGAGAPARFGIATPPDSPFIPRTAQEPKSPQMFSGPPSPPSPPVHTSDPCANSRWGSAAQPTQVPSAQPAGQNIRHDGLNRRDWAAIDKKVSKQLVPFDGDPANYKNWNERVRDHSKGSTPNSKYVFQAVQSAKTQIRIADCRHWRMPNGHTCDLLWAAQHLWSLIGSNITNTVHMRRLRLTMNEEDNGLELWRMLSLEKEGGAEQVKIAGMNDLHSFPQCPSAADVVHYTGQWNITRMKHGNDLPDAHLRQMYLNMLPEKIASDIRDKSECNTLQRCMDQVMKDIHRYNDGKLARIHSQRLKQMLSRGPKNPVNSLIPQEEQRAGQDDKTSICALAEKLDGLVAALNNQNGAGRGRPPPPRSGDSKGDRSPRDRSPRASSSPKPNPKFEGCWCC